MATAHHQRVHVAVTAVSPNNHVLTLLTTAPTRDRAVFVAALTEALSQLAWQWSTEDDHIDHEEETS